MLTCDACGEALQGKGTAAFDLDAAGARMGRFRLLHAGCELGSPNTLALPRMDLAEFLSALWSNAGLSGDVPRSHVHG